MQNINNYITEKLKISSKMYKGYSCQPQTREELRKILEERLKEDKNADLNDIDVSQITDMGRDEDGAGLFEWLGPKNIDISNWDVSGVENMTDMFYNCDKFTGKGLENWNVSNLKNMHAIFFGCSVFNANLKNWDVSKVTDLSWVFFDCTNFTGEGLENWKPSTSNMGHIFEGCDSLKKYPDWYKIR